MSCSKSSISKIQKQIILSQDGPKPEKVSLKDIMRMGISYWMLVVIITLHDICLFVFHNILVKCIEERFLFSNQTSGRFSSLPFIISASLTPFFGILADRIGKKSLFCKQKSQHAFDL
jgi:hypothetical protein